MAKKRKWQPIGRLTLTLLVVGLLLAGMQIVRLRHRLEQARSEEAAYRQTLTQLLQENQQLENEIANSGNIQVILDIARDELGMAQSDEKIFRFGN